MRLQTTSEMRSQTTDKGLNRKKTPFFAPTADAPPATALNVKESALLIVIIDVWGNQYRHYPKF